MDTDQSQASAPQISEAWKPNKVTGDFVTNGQKVNGSKKNPDIVKVDPVVDIDLNDYAISKPLKSCMSVSNLHESLESCGDVNDKPIRRTSLPTRRVSFDSIQIREYERQLGDNPSCISGPPITLGWEHQDEMQFNVDHYEDVRPDRRDRFQLMIPGEVREDMVRDSGHSRKEITKAVRQVNIIRQRRRNSINSKKERLDELMESARRKIKRMVKKKSGKQQELEMWSQSQSCTIKRSCSDLVLTNLVETINRNYSIPDMTDVERKTIEFGDFVPMQGAADNSKSSEEEAHDQKFSSLNRNYSIPDPKAISAIFQHPSIQSAGADNDEANIGDLETKQATAEKVVDTDETSATDDDWFF